MLHLTRMRKKVVEAECMFPELHGAFLYRTGHGRATTTRAAISRAFGNALRQIKSKRITDVQARLRITNNKGAGK